MSGVDSARIQRYSAGPGYQMRPRTYEPVACNFAMDDGAPCGRVFTPTVPNSKRCDRHNHGAYVLRSKAEMRIRRQG